MGSYRMRLCPECGVFVEVVEVSRNRVDCAVCGYTWWGSSFIARVTSEWKQQGSGTRG